MRPSVRLHIQTNDPQRAATFYRTVFGWTLPTDGGRSRWVVTSNDDQRLGVDGPAAAEAIVPAVHVDNLDRTVVAAVAAGAEVLVPRAPCPGVGWLAYLCDPDGNLIGVMQDDTEAGRTQTTARRERAR